MHPEPEYHVGDIVEIIKTDEDQVRIEQFDKFVGLRCRICYVVPWSKDYGYLYRLEPENPNTMVSGTLRYFVRFVWSKESLILAEDKDYVNDISDDDILDFIGGNYEI